MTMTWYKATVDPPCITPVEIDELKIPRIGDDYGYFETKEDAYNFLLHVADRRIKSAQVLLKSGVDYLYEVWRLEVLT
jgi:hypothetical protein